MSREIHKEAETHESFGVISFGRVSGTARSLVGSNIKHGNTMRLTISEAKQYREYQHSRFYPQKKLIEVEMSASQFAEAITTINNGEGVPVTLKRVAGKQIANPPDVDFKERAKNELKKEMGELAEKIDELAKDAKEILTKKGNIKVAEKEKILKDLMFLTQEVRSNIPFAHECFQEAVDDTVVQAKAEVDNCLTTMREKLGQKVIDGQIEIPLLGE